LTQFGNNESFQANLENLVDFEYYDASNFRSNQVDMVVSSEEHFSQISIILDTLGFQINRSKCLDDLFSSISEDPERTAIVVICMDQNNIHRLESHFRLLKMMDYHLPVLILDCGLNTGSGIYEKKIYRDCVHHFTCATSILSKQIYSAVLASLAWSSEIDRVHASSIMLLEKIYKKH